jgi:hypothetical protein
MCGGSRRGSVGGGHAARARTRPGPHTIDHTITPADDAAQVIAIAPFRRRARHGGRSSGGLRRFSAGARLPPPSLGNRGQSAAVRRGARPGGIGAGCEGSSRRPDRASEGTCNAQCPHEQEVLTAQGLFGDDSLRSTCLACPRPVARPVLFTRVGSLLISRDAGVAVMSLGPDRRAPGEISLPEGRCRR